MKKLANFKPVQKSSVHAQQWHPIIQVVKKVGGGAQGGKLGKGTEEPSPTFCNQMFSNTNKTRTTKADVHLKYNKAR